MNNSVNASNGQETQEKAWWRLLWGPVDARMHELGMYEPYYSPKNEGGPCINPTQSTEMGLSK